MILLSRKSSASLIEFKSHLMSKIKKLQLELEMTELSTQNINFVHSFQ